MSKTSENLILSGCTVDRRLQLIQRGNEVLRLTTRELELLDYFVEHAGKNIPREELLVEVWGYHESSMTRAVDNMVRKLRAKIETDPRNPIHIHTVHGKGYRFEIAVTTHTAVPDSDQPAPFVPRENNLPKHWTPFVGRGGALKQLTDTLRGRIRWATVMGPSGIGKTRIACEAAQALLADDTAQSVLFVDLSNATNDETVLNAFESVLFTGAMETVTWDRVHSAVAARDRLLFVVDNAEQVSELLRNHLDVLLKKCDSLRILVTSQHRLQHPAEKVLKLEPLKPDEARELFLERAHDLGAVGLNRSDAQRDVDRLVKKLDGLPLALELAASRTGVLHVSTLCDMVERQTELLNNPNSDNVRHSSLDRAITWSWGLLDEEECELLIQCSVFEDGFNLEACAHVVQLEVTSSASLLSQLQHLVDKSMLMVAAPRPGESDLRFHLPQNIRRFARARLEASGVEKDIYERHATWLVDWVSGEPTLRSLSAETGNLRAALLWSRRNAHGTHTLLTYAYQRLGRCTVTLQEVAEHLHFSMRHPSEQTTTRQLNTLCLAIILGDQGEHDRAVELLHEVLGPPPYAALPPSNLTANGLNVLAMAHRRQGQLEKALALLSISLKVSETLKSRSLRYHSLHRQALCFIDLGKFNDALSHCHEAYTCASDEDGEMLGALYSLQGTIYMCQGKMGLARSSLLRSIEIYEKAGLFAKHTHTLAILAMHRAEEGRITEAIIAIEQVIVFYRKQGQIGLVAVELNRLAHCHMIARDAVAMATCSRDALTLHRRAESRSQETLSHVNLGIAHRMLEHYNVARQDFEAALELSGHTNRQFAFHSHFHLIAISALESPEKVQFHFDQAESLVATDLTLEQFYLELASLFLNHSANEALVFEKIETAPLYPRSADLRLGLELTKRDLKRLKA